MHATSSQVSRSGLLSYSRGAWVRTPLRGSFTDGRKETPIDQQVRDAERGKEIQLFRLMNIINTTPINNPPPRMATIGSGAYRSSHVSIP